jgi:prolyl-tRNA editing enzyme YbaK/EbsC (Cys-tRNA(Pro) deacylase)
VALVSGSNRVDLALLGAATGTTNVRKADGDEARAATGFAIGGVPPFGHTTSVRIVVDRDLMAHDVVWAAAGLPDAVFPIAAADLVRVSGAQVVDIAEAG